MVPFMEEILNDKIIEIGNSLQLSGLKFWFWGGLSEGSVYGYKRAKQEIFAVMELFCILTMMWRHKK